MQREKEQEKQREAAMAAKQKQLEIEERWLQRRMELEREGKENKAIEKILRDEQKKMADQEKQKRKEEEKMLAEKRKQEEAEQSRIQSEQKEEEAQRLQDEKKFAEIRDKLKKEAAAKEEKRRQRLLNEKQLEALGLTVASLKTMAEIEVAYEFADVQYFRVLADAQKRAEDEMQRERKREKEREKERERELAFKEEEEKESAESANDSSFKNESSDTPSVLLSPSASQSTLNRVELLSSTHDVPIKDSIIRNTNKQQNHQIISQ
ncbi:uncharacterized protein MONOS_6484 [Monocercomonoides exilis]|uniref:uncharacterized protein n=1 Tax=Monocercomonoides exilis TaxID=2049356 RepID=UPI00355A0C09|nr:hypothetical protein MONOS_6484 [Monocercomonoides exilis]|eukprot:MONOS_6484.1-p1 / transcript=MONOS_6484.1 / gene=MONOS_6484 / organism=Monocercomonoides_exilis_PA203 / gene_product=unspecified product / transcript_product=unspecified product / location=Mono_scaffold00205:2454-3248(-) / protein_length=265 / sequence_SO=supercontig / SO=protein_coding / is_pseudo=false